MAPQMFASAEGRDPVEHSLLLVLSFPVCEVDGCVCPTQCLLSHTPLEARPLPPHHVRRDPSGHQGPLPGTGQCYPSGFYLHCGTVRDAQKRLKWKRACRLENKSVELCTQPSPPPHAQSRTCTTIEVHEQMGGHFHSHTRSHTDPRSLVDTLPSFPTARLHIQTASISPMPSTRPSLEVMTGIQDSKRTWVAALCQGGTLGIRPPCS